MKTKVKVMVQEEKNLKAEIAQIGSRWFNLGKDLRISM